MPEAPPEISPNVRQLAADTVRKERSYIWVPPVVALLLLLLLLATLLWPASQAGSGGPDGASTGTGDRAGAGSGTGDSVAGGAADTGLIEADGSGNVTAKPALDRSGAFDSHGSSAASAPVSPEASRVGSTSVGHTQALVPSMTGVTPDAEQTPSPRLGFQVDLLAPPANQPELPVSEAVPSVAGTVNPGLASFFGQTGRGSRFVYVIDRSGSMKGPRFDAARFELIKSIRSLREDELFYVIFYDSRATPMPAKGLVPADEGNQQQHIAWIRSISVGGGTDPTEAITLALSGLRPDTIWLLSDGQFNVAVADTIRRLNPGGRVQINTIAFHDRGGEAILKIIADENDGDYRFVAP
ncbi:MAG: VWA domain-containing protein [Planctomycetota bacterium]